MFTSIMKSLKTSSMPNWRYHLPKFVLQSFQTSGYGNFCSLHWLETSNLSFGAHLAKWSPKNSRKQSVTSKQLWYRRSRERRRWWRRRWRQRAGKAEKNNTSWLKVLHCSSLAHFWSLLCFSDKLVIFCVPLVIGKNNERQTSGFTKVAFEVNKWNRLGSYPWQSPSYPIIPLFQSAISLLFSPRE